MIDALRGQTVLAGAALSGLRWQFTRPSEDTTTNYTNSAITVRLFVLSKGKPTSTTPDLILTIGSGLTRSTNTATTQAGLLAITPSQLATLLGTAEARQVAYAWYIQPTGYESVRAFVGGGYDGRFILAKEGYAGSEDDIRVS